MKKLVALALGLLVLSALAFFFLRLTQGGPRGQARPEPEVATPAAAPDAAALLVAAAGNEPSAAASAPDEADRPAGSREAPTLLGQGRILTGQVRLPAGAPADASLRVLAFEKELRSEEVYGAEGALAPENPQEKPAAEGRVKREKLRWMAEAPVAADGSFRLALGTDGAVHLAVDGRFVYSDPLTLVAAGAQATVLEVELGACISGTVRLPAGLADPAAAQQSLSVSVGPDPTQLSLAAGRTGFQSRLARPDSAGLFELRALKSTQVHVLVAESDVSADLTLPGLKLAGGELRTFELTLPLGATVRGQVVDERGMPVPAARVRAAESAMWGFAGESRAETESDADGRFVLAHVPTGRGLLLAEKDGYLESTPLTVEFVEREDRSGVTLELGRGASISGQVRLPDGAAAAGTDVAVRFDLESMMGVGAANASRGADGKTKCDAEGRFEVTGLGKGPFTVSATFERSLGDGVEEKWKARLDKVAPDSHGLELVLVAPAVLEGRVTDAAGQPLERFHVSASQPGAVFFDPGQTQGQDFVDANGNFVLRNLEPGRWQVSARAEGFAPMAPVEVELPRSAAEPLVLSLQAEAGVSGLVLDPGGRPLAGARVTTPGDLGDTMRRLQGREKPPETVSDAEGRFELLGLGPDIKAIHAVHEAYAPSAPFPLELGAGERIQDVTLRLSRGGRVTGEVYDKDGELARNTQVIAQNRGTFEMSMARTDAQGAFAFERLSAGPWTITAMLEQASLEGAADAPDNAAALMNNLRFEMIDLAEGEEKHVVLGAPPEAPVTVHGIVRHGGEPLSQGLVSFVPDGMKSVQGMKLQSVSADGTFTALLDHPGEYIVSVQIQSASGGFQQDTIEFRRSVPEVEEHTIELDLPLAGIRGRVRGADGAPAANMRVSLTVEGGVQTGSMLGGHFAEAMTDANGTYTFRYLRPGSYTVAAGGALFGGAFGTAASGGRRLRNGVRVNEGELVEGIDFELAAPCNLEGRVRDSNGAPVKDASIFVRNSDGRLVDRLSMTTTAADGSFTYTGVEPGEYFVSARTKDLASSDSARVRTTHEAPGKVELVVLAGSRLVVEVVDSEDKPAQALVTVLDAQGREVQGMLGFSELSSAFAEGFDSTQQKIGPVPPGSYTVIALGLDGKRVQKPVNLDGQAERRMKLRLKE